jgi:hypothetical protein
MASLVHGSTQDDADVTGATREILLSALTGQTSPVKAIRFHTRFDRLCRAAKPHAAHEQWQVHILAAAPRLEQLVILWSRLRTGRLSAEASREGRTTMVDRTTKILLGLIAFGLLANVTVSLSRPAIAQNLTLAQENNLLLRNIATDLVDVKVYVGSIANAVCANRKLCGP